MMKSIIHLCIKDLDPLKLVFTEPNITFLSLGIHKSSHHKILTYEC